MPTDECAVLPERCPTCGQPVGRWKPARVCGLCHQPMRRGHKWQIVNSTIQHRDCQNPESYGKNGTRFYEHD